MSMALGCDLVVASDTARFSQIFSKRGLSVDFGASWLLPRFIGMHRAKELAFFADILDAKQAQEFGLVNRVVPGDQLMGEAMALAGRIAKNAPMAVRRSKQLMIQSSELTEDEAWELNDSLFGEIGRSADAMEGAIAFAEKREPNWTGK